VDCPLPLLLAARKVVEGLQPGVYISAISSLGNLIRAGIRPQLRELSRVSPWLSLLPVICHKLSFGVVFPDLTVTGASWKSSNFFWFKLWYSLTRALESTRACVGSRSMEPWGCTRVSQSSFESISWHVGTLFVFPWWSTMCHLQGTLMRLFRFKSSWGFSLNQRTFLARTDASLTVSHLWATRLGG
jgi:hypothetical protein